MGDEEAALLSAKMDRIRASLAGLSHDLTEETSMSGNTNTTHNVTVAFKIATARVALDKLVEHVEARLTEHEIDVGFLRTPFGRALVKAALPTLLLALLDTDAVSGRVSPNVRDILEDSLNAAQLAGLMDGMEPVLNMAVDLISDFAKVQGLLEEGAKEADPFFEALTGKEAVK